MPALEGTAVICDPPGDMARAEKGHVLQKSGSDLVMCGGQTQGTACDKYNKDTGTWETVAYMTMSKRFMAASC